VALTFKKEKNYAKISQSRSITCKKKKDFEARQGSVWCPQERVDRCQKRV
jgi:hypothetical protein